MPLFASFGQLGHFVPASIPDYRVLELSLEPLALWPMADTSGIVMDDIVGSRNGAYVNTPTFGVAALPAESDQAVDFAGVAKATIPHDGGLLLSAVTLVFWFKLASLPADGARFFLFGKDSAGNNAGDTAVLVEDDGALTIQMRSATATLTVPNQRIIGLGVPYHVVVRMDTAGFDAYLNGRYLGKNTGYLGAWSTNTAQIEIATSIAYPLSATPANFVLDELKIFPRVLTETEVLELWQKTDPPIAVGFPTTVPESATTSIDVLPGCTFVGTPTLQIVTPPAAGTLAINGQLFSYTTGAVGGDVARPWSYRIVDANGQSNIATVNMTVLDAGTPVVANANCFQILGTNNVTVATVAQLNAALIAAGPGTQILVTVANFTGGTVNINAQGTQANPIVIRPQGGRGATTVNNTWTFDDNADWVVVYGFNFVNAPRITMNGDHNRITRCSFSQFLVAVDLITARDCRVDHCDFSAYQNQSGPKACIHMDPSGFDNNTNARNLIDYCHFHDINPTTTINGTELVRFDAQNVNMDLTIDVCTVDHCLFEDIALGAQENEIISVKSGGWTVQFCTFQDCTAMWLNLRTSNNSEIRSNWFQNVSSNGAALGVKGDNHLIIGNVCVGNVNLMCCRGDGTAAQVIAGQGIGIHPRAENCRFVGNQFETGRILVGTQAFGQPTQVAALNNNIPKGATVGANVRTGGGGGDPYQLDPIFAVGTTFAADAEAFVLATQLTAAQVGVAAPDALCPTGPQN